MESKVCKKCGAEKALNVENFAQYKNSARQLRYRPECRECSKSMCKNYKANNRQKISDYNKAYKADHQEETREYNQRYFRDRKEVDPEFRIKCRNRSRISDLLRGTERPSSVELLSCDYEFFVKWLEHQFDANMTMDNYGTYWHLDHVKPCSSFDLTRLDDQRKCFHWTNYRPCEGKENIKKSAKIDESILEEQSERVIRFIDQLDHEPDLTYSIYV